MGSNEKKVQKKAINATIRGNDITILREANPEVFSVLPDPGHSSKYGATATGTEKKLLDQSRTSGLKGPSTSWGRIQTAMQEVWRQKELQMSTEEDGLNFDNMLPVAMSTVILLATTPDAVPMEYYMWTEKYLSCIKDDSGIMPHNIGNMVRMIRQRCRDLGYKWDPEWGMMPPETPEDKISRKRAKKERTDAKKEVKEIKRKEGKYEDRQEAREKLELKRAKAKARDAKKIQEETASNESKASKEENKQSKQNGRDSSPTRTKGERDASPAHSGSPARTSRNGSPQSGSRSSSQYSSSRASANGKPRSPRTSQTRQAAGGRTSSGSSRHRKDEV